MKKTAIVHVLRKFLNTEMLKTPFLKILLKLLINIKYRHVADKNLDNLGITIALLSDLI